ncbi:MAG: hypothetical protein M1827_004044 [Pycnora praestabilis]|nr:MAG: hypothetical protein M1827_004044 [Pycnora praestabilis]
MRGTIRLFARVKPGRFLEPNTPTGLTGLFTHPAPRSTLIYLYSSTLDKLKHLPEASVYRQSTESLTRHRLKVVESIKPEGYDAWADRAKKQIAEHPEVFNTPTGGVDHEGGSSGKHVKNVRDGRSFVTTELGDEPDERLEEWDGQTLEEPQLEGPKTTAERASQDDIGLRRPGTDRKTLHWEPEPPLDKSQISDMETQIAAGLIEEVIQVAEGELKLVETMAEARVWEELEEKPAEGQWSYFERGTHSPKGQAP